MSRIGQKPIEVPSGVEIKVEGQHVAVRGSKGELDLKVNEKIAVSLDDGILTVTRPDDERQTRALHGLMRSLISNMVQGVAEGFEKKLEINGVGYRAQAKGSDKLELQLGFSHPIIYQAPEGVTFELPEATEIIVRGIDKQAVGQVAAEIRAFRKPEPYKGKGIKYADERIIRKAGKSATAVGAA